jgi:DNA-binding response OmpR family regulator
MAFSPLPPESTSTTRTTDHSMTTSANAGIRVLVIDDEPAICRIVTHSLKRNGFDVESISDPLLVEATLNNADFHVILLDRSMSGFKGSSLVPLLREQAPQAKILYFTGEFVDAEEVATVDGVVQKPINGKELTETLRRVL